MKKAFTLAEMMIVLVVIAVITAILLPAARHATPDENILKFKKAHNTLYTTIRELVNSDKYYLDGDLGVKPNGDLIDGTHESDATYFCKTIADVINAKNANCDDYKNIYTNFKNSYVNVINGKVGDSNKNATTHFDDDCKNYPEAGKTGTIELNNVIYYDCAPNTVFGSLNKDDIHESYSGCLSSGSQDVNDCSENGRKFLWTHNGFYMNYKIFCIDIDGINQGEDPFGYGIRVDGKIIAGARADEWLNKSINKKD